MDDVNAIAGERPPRRATGPSPMVDAVLSQSRSGVVRIDRFIEPGQRISIARNRPGDTRTVWLGRRNWDGDSTPDYKIKVKRHYTDLHLSDAAVADLRSGDKLHVICRAGGWHGRLVWTARQASETETGSDPRTEEVTQYAPAQPQLLAPIIDPTVYSHRRTAPPRLDRTDPTRASSLMPDTLEPRIRRPRIRLAGSNLARWVRASGRPARPLRPGWVWAALFLTCLAAAVWTSKPGTTNPGTEGPQIADGPNAGDPTEPLGLTSLESEPMPDVELPPGTPIVPIPMEAAGPEALPEAVVEDVPMPVETLEASIHGTPKPVTIPVSALRSDRVSPDERVVADVGASHEVDGADGMAATRTSAMQAVSPVGAEIAWVDRIEIADAVVDASPQSLAVDAVIPTVAAIPIDVASAPKPEPSSPAIASEVASPSQNLREPVSAEPDPIPVGIFGAIEPKARGEDANALAVIEPGLPPVETPEPVAIADLASSVPVAPKPVIEDARPLKPLRLSYPRRAEKSSRVPERVDLVVAFTVDRTGNVSEARISDMAYADHHAGDFRREALRAIESQTYAPKTVDGVAVPDELTQSIIFVKS